MAVLKKYSSGVFRSIFLLRVLVITILVSSCEFQLNPFEGATYKTTPLGGRIGVIVDPPAPPIDSPATKSKEYSEFMSVIENKKYGCIGCHSAYSSYQNPKDWITAKLVDPTGDFEKSKILYRLKGAGILPAQEGMPKDIDINVDPDDIKKVKAFIEWVTSQDLGILAAVYNNGNVVVQDSEVDFRTEKVGGYAPKVLLEFRNPVQAKSPVRISQVNIANSRFKLELNEGSGSVEPGMTRKMIFRLDPSQVGEFKSKVNLVIEGAQGQKQVSFNLVGNIIDSVDCSENPKVVLESSMNTNFFIKNTIEDLFRVQIEDIDQFLPPHILDVERKSAIKNQLNENWFNRYYELTEHVADVALLINSVGGMRALDTEFSSRCNFRSVTTRGQMRACLTQALSPVLDRLGISDDGFLREIANQLNISTDSADETVKPAFLLRLAMKRVLLHPQYVLSLRGVATIQDPIEFRRYLYRKLLNQLPPTDTSDIDGASLGELSNWRESDWREFAKKLMDRPEFIDRGLRAFAEGYLSRPLFMSALETETIQTRKALWESWFLSFKEQFLQESSPLANLLMADDFFVNESVASFVNFNGSFEGESFVKTRSERFAGLHRHPAFMALTGLGGEHRNIPRTGFKFMNMFMCWDPGNPVPSVGKDPETYDGSYREMFEIKTGSGVCLNCHKVLNPTGFAFSDRSYNSEEIKTDRYGFPIVVKSSVWGYEFANSYELGGHITKTLQYQQCFSDHLVGGFIGRLNLENHSCLSNELGVYSSSSSIRGKILDLLMHPSLRSNSFAFRED